MKLFFFMYVLKIDKKLLIYPNTSTDLGSDVALGWFDDVKRSSNNENDSRNYHLWMQGNIKFKLMSWDEVVPSKIVLLNLCPKRLTIKLGSFFYFFCAILT